MNKKYRHKIKLVFEDKKFSSREISVIEEFVTNFYKIYGDKYLDRILSRLNELEEIRYEFNDSKYQASSKKKYIVFFKDIQDDNEFKYVLEHELFHSIQKEGSAFEKIPLCYENILDKDIKIHLLEEAYVQYFTAKINNKFPEFLMEDEEENIKKYWLNECYKDIVGVVEELENMIGQDELLDMYMDDERYIDEIKKFDEKYGENEFAKYIQKICENNES